jgi:phenylalanyl-tRNA synthetase beta subunit
LIESADLFDLYQKGERQSVAIKLVYQARDRTLTSQEVAKVREKISQKLRRKFKVEIRER